MKKAIALIYGGEGAEHDISLLSAENISENIDRDKFDVVSVFISKSGEWLIDNAPAFPIRLNGRSGFYTADKIIPIDAALPILHGDLGEDGAVSGLLKSAHIRFVGCDVSAGAVCADKIITRSVADSLSIPGAKWIFSDKNDPFWKTPGFGGAEYSDALVNCKIPILFIGAWHDIYISGMVDIWRKLAPEHRKKCVFIITPFDHSYSKRPANIAPELFSPGGQISEFVPIRRGLPEYWFDHLRLGTPLEYLTKGEINRYVLFGDRWESSPEIGSSSKYCKFYLNTDRTLSVTPVRSGKISYKYDPRDPAVFQGACHGNFGGVAVQNPPNSRQDIISFVSAPFEEDKTIEGDFKGRLYVTSTAPDSCFYIRLSVVNGDRAFGLRNEIDSICRTNPDFVPGKEAAIDFSIAPHHFKVAKGDRLRLDISSSCFPYFQLHSNFRGNQALQTGTQVADNTLFTGKSYIEIPFAPERKSK